MSISEVFSILNEISKFKSQVFQYFCFNNPVVADDNYLKVCFGTQLLGEDEYGKIDTITLDSYAVLESQTLPLTWLIRCEIKNASLTATGMVVCALPSSYPCCDTTSWLVRETGNFQITEVSDFSSNITLLLEKTMTDLKNSIKEKHPVDKYLPYENGKVILIPSTGYLNPDYVFLTHQTNVI